MTKPNTSVLSTDKLTIGYKGKKSIERTVAKDLFLELKSGKFICLLGPNGAGKSTLIRTLSGIQEPLSGSIDLIGQKLDQMDPKERARSVSLVLTDTLPVGIFTAYSLVALGRHPHTKWSGGLTQNDHDKINWALKAVNAEALADRNISELSDGEKQKIMIARALAQEAQLMLLDEPTAYLDILRRVELMRTLRDLSHNENLSILLSTHDLELAMRSADELWLFSENGSITKGHPEHLALTGEIARVFSNKELDWDIEQGSFRIHREACLHASLKGEGPAKVWTQRTLSRLGYGLTDDKHQVAFSIAITNSTASPIWEVTHKEGNSKFNSLEELCNWIQSLPSNH